MHFKFNGRVLRKLGAVAASLAIAVGSMNMVSYAMVLRSGAAKTVTSVTAPVTGNTSSASTGIYIYVGKRSRTLTLYQGSTILGKWPCNVGTYSNSGDKKTEGDSTTPSGTFYVCVRNDKSVCYKALGISYPMIDDAQRGLNDGIITQDQFDQIKTAVNNKQQPLWNTALGGFVEIHGCYGEGKTTHGCVAVDNSVMDILWDKCPMGTTIQIGP